MKLIKIEGNLLSTPQQIEEIIQSLVSSHPTYVTIAISGNHEIENTLEQIARNSKDVSFDFANETNVIEAYYLNLTREVIPVMQQSAVLSFVKQRCNELEDLCKGIQLLGESPIKTLNEIRRLSSVILSYLIFKSISHVYEDVSYGEVSEKKKLHIIPVHGLNDKEKINNTSSISSDVRVAQIAIEQDIHSIEFWTDQSQYYTADPTLVKNAMPISELGYEEAVELMNYDQHIIDPQALGLLIHHKKNISILHKRNGSVYTSIKKSVEEKKEMITGISSLEGISLINVEGSGMIGVPGFAKRVFECLYNSNINVILISQGASEHSICVAVKSIYSILASEHLSTSFSEEIMFGIVKPIQIIEHTSIIALVGENMRSHPGISGRMFYALGRNGINVLAIAQGSNEKNISAVIRSSDKEKALNVLHETFFEYTKKEINLFIIGTGNVGKKLIAQIKQQYPKIAATQNIKMNVAGICNSRTMLMDPSGIELEGWEEKLAAGQRSDINSFTNKIKALNLRNSVLIDMTANKTIPEVYAGLLKKSMSIVACNKIAASDRFTQYKKLKDLALEFNCKFLFETNVGAALPIIGTLNDIIKSGDKIVKIQAVLSGTLNYVFNQYNGEKSFAQVVRDAQREGYTEPDPRLDLSGMDVMRKIMILVRESGQALEIEDVLCESFLPESCMKGTVEDFYQEMENHEHHFRQILHEAASSNSTLKFVANYENGKASVGLMHIQPESEMYHLYGKDNIVLFYTERYHDQPLVVKGAGAGADVTASGVFADILRTIN